MSATDPHQPEYTYNATAVAAGASMTAVTFDDGNTSQNYRGCVFGTVYLANDGANSMDYEIHVNGRKTHSGTIANGADPTVQDITHIGHDIEVRLQSASGTTADVEIRGIGR